MKSRSNAILSSLMQIFYYVAQYFFWLGVQNTAGGRSFIAHEYLLGFLVTIALVDNAYLFFFGKGSLIAADAIQSGNLEPYLLRPRHPLIQFVVDQPNWAFAPAFVVSIIFGIIILPGLNLSATQLVIYLLSVVFGISILNAISFLFRLTPFWTTSIIQVRNANPSFKILVRPFDSFQGKIKLVLLTIFPALFITGVPSEILAGSKGWIWLLYALFAVLLLSTYVYAMWNFGVRRYGRLR
jgi:ABC-2 type transport system permease protein